MTHELEELEQELSEGSPQSMRDLLQEFISLEKRRRDAEGEAEELKAKIQKIEPLLREEMALCGLTTARCDGLTVYVKTDRYVSKKGDFTTEQICEVLRKHGLDYMIGEAYSAASLKSKVLEWLDNQNEIPVQLAEMLNVGEMKKLATRKG